jgi:putative hydrolase of the HAD superfamily
MAISAIGLDVDGTLYPNFHMRRKSLPRVVRRLRFFRSYRRVRETLRTRGQVGDFYSEQARLLGEKLGVEPAEARERIQRVVYDDLAEVIADVAPYPGIAEFLREMAAEGFPIGLLSDFPFGTKLDLLGLPGVWRCRICAEETGALKPHPHPFATLADCLGVPAAEVLYVGNSYRADVLGAKGAGMMAAHLVRRPPRDSEADISFSSYPDLAAWIRTNR